MFDSGWQDVRYAARSLLRRPLVSAVAVLSLALGIGVNTAIFSVFDRLLLRELPIPAPDEIVLVTSPGRRPGSTSTSNAGGRDHVFSLPLFRDLERLADTGLVHLAAERDFAANLAHGGQTERRDGVVVSGHYFAALGVGAVAGRVLTADDDRTPGGHPVAVLSHRYWTTRFGASPSVVGTTLTVNGHPMTIVGVAAAGFGGTTIVRPPDVFVPLAMRAQVRTGGDERDNHWLYAIGRLQPGVAPAQAQERMDRAFSGLIRDVEYPFFASRLTDAEREPFLSRRLVLEEGARPRMTDRDEARLILTLLLTVTGLVLLIACANVANLLLAKAIDGAGEAGIRRALGATGARLLRLHLVEAVLLGSLGAAGALLVARGTLQALLAIMPATDQSMAQFEINPTILLFTLALGIGTGLLFGLAPAVHAVRAGRVRTDAPRASMTRTTARFRTSLAAAQVALATVLLSQAALFLTSLANLGRVELGLQRDGVLSFRLSPYLNGYSPDRALALAERIQEELRATPGVLAVTASSDPVLDGNTSRQNLTVEGVAPGPDADTTAYSARVAPGYFRTLGIGLVAGRDFTAADRAGAPRVAIVNDAFARKFGLGGDAIGRRIGLGTGDDVTLDIEIVGLVRDAGYSDVREPMLPQVLLPYQQHGWGGITIYIRSSSDPSALRTLVPAIVRRADPNLPVERLRTMDEQIWDNTTRDRVLAILSSSFAGLATLLAGLGLYAVLVHTVASRLREMGIRIALGARPVDVTRLVSGYVGRITMVGAVIGLAAALGLARLARALLFGVNGHDPAVVGGAVAAVACMALAAAAVPARRAAMVDPARALRAE